MQKELSFKLLPSDALNESVFRKKLAEHAGVPPQRITGYHILRRSVDARGKSIFYTFRVLVFVDEPPQPRPADTIHFRDVSQARHRVAIVGTGPAGLFAALRCIELGIKPILLERGKDVRARRRDLAALNKQGEVNPESNYCFGEGGAGTYSDGKLYTRSSKRGNISRILQLFVRFGADETILYDAHPHIGTNKLPHIITAMRDAIIEAGGEVHFECKMTGFKLQDGRIEYLETPNGHVQADAYILATGHSARDVFELLHQHRIQIEAKPFALGVRVEHPQALINEIQYHCAFQPDELPPASYSLVQQIQQKGMFSFCMCPGGIIAPAATAPGEIVVNGWSPSKRNNPFANSGIVVEVNQHDAYAVLKETGISADDPLLLLSFQQMVEKAAYTAGGGQAVAPAQRLVDFCEQRTSTSLPSNSYLPGLHSFPLQEVLPEYIYRVLSKGFPQFGKKMKGYYTNEAIVVATESRTSSPVKIPRHSETLTHPQIQNLYPCGEGAGYAGGIVSAAMDGERVASTLALLLQK